MPLHLFNTLSGKVEEFQPQSDTTVRMYACGPTVYDYGHIGNFRTFVLVDVLRRFLKQSGYRVDHVMNITDVDDKIIRNSASAGLSVQQYTRKYEEAFLEDMDALKIERPEHIVRATENIPEMASFVARLQEKGFAYRSEDGSYYFPIARFPDYGKLSKKGIFTVADGARVDVDEYEKENARDFALWKAPKPGEAIWQTAIGPGRPGWHIECSAMAMKYLGETLDLHAGGEDLIFPHHENEIAQSEALTGKPFAHFWMHCRFLLVNGEKMSKSLGNFFTLRDLLLKGHKASSIRYLLSSVPYRRQLNFTLGEGLVQAEHSVDRLRNFAQRLTVGQFPEGSNAVMQDLARNTGQKMTAALQDDLNTAEALAAIFDMARGANSAADSGQLKQGDVPCLLSALRQFDEIFAVLRDDDAEVSRRAFAWAHGEGLLTDEQIGQRLDVTSDEEIEAQVNQRNAAKKARDFAKADAIRDLLAAKGIILEDTKGGVRWKRK